MLLDPAGVTPSLSLSILQSLQQTGFVVKCERAQGLMHVLQLKHSFDEIVRALHNTDLELFSLSFEVMSSIYYIAMVVRIIV